MSAVAVREVTSSEAVTSNRFDEPFVVRAAVRHWRALETWSLHGLAHASSSLGHDRLVTAQFAPLDSIGTHTVGRGELDRARRLCSLADFVRRFLLAREALHGFERTLHWGYVSYCHLRELIGEDERCDDVDWRAFVADARAIDSTLWIGSAGAFTPAHYDSYGCNWVAQLDGRKRWRLFAPSSADMPATRVPFEESTVWLAKDVRQCAGGFETTLEPGDVLFVPHRYWHFVESLTDSVSVNLWVPHADDAAAAQLEALARALVERLVAGLAIGDELALVNPSEDEGVAEENLDDVTRLLHLRSPLTLERFIAAVLTSDVVDCMSRASPHLPPALLRAALEQRLRGASDGDAPAVPHAQLLHAATQEPVLRAVYSSLLAAE